MTNQQTGEDVVDWAVRTGRLTASSRDTYRARLHDGRITEADIRSLASALPTITAGGGNRQDIAPALRARLNSGPTPRASTRPVARAGAPTAYDGNPLVESARAANPGLVNAASRLGQPPTLFASGNVPPFCASGIDPSVLEDVPWQARHAVASAPTLSTAYELVQRYAGPRGHALAAAEQGTDAVTMTYRESMVAWLEAALGPDELAVRDSGASTSGQWIPALLGEDVPFAYARSQEIGPHTGVIVENRPSRTLNAWLTMAGGADET